MISRDTYIELTKFGIVGVICFGIDVGVYYGLSQVAPTSVSKFFSFLIGTIANYNFNKFWTWGQSDRDQKRLYKYLILYGLSLTVNVLANEFFLSIIPNNLLEVNIFNDKTGKTMSLVAFKFDKILALIGATAVSMVINFFGQKWWVFKGEKLNTEAIG